jgi:hypothetical protein
MRFKAKGSCATLLILGVAAWIGLLACAGPGTQIVYLQFRPTGTPTPPSSFTVGVAPFQDDRAEPQLLGKRFRVDGSVETIMLGAPTPAKDLTHMAIRHLEGQGMRVLDLPSWRPAPETLGDLPRDVRVAITGRIDALEVQVSSSLFKTTVKYRVRITGFLGLVDKGEVVTRTLEIGPQKTTFQFDIREIEEELNRAVAEAFSRLFEGVAPPSR